MATWEYPPLPPDTLEREADSALARELEWLLRSLQDSLTALREGLRECAALLAPKEPGSTLVLSSLRSESVKGFVTRVGTKVVKGVCFCAILPLISFKHAFRLPSTTCDVAANVMAT
jgi:hypothetical protein